MNAAVLGFGEMGIKAVEALIEAKQTDVLVVSRNPSLSAQRAPELAQKCTMISYEEWNQGKQQPELVISTIRNASPTYHEQHPFPVQTPATVMDFSWPPSFEPSGVSDQQMLMGMDHWIKVSRNLGKEWDYDSTIGKSESMIDTIQGATAMPLRIKPKASSGPTSIKPWRGLQKHGKPPHLPPTGMFRNSVPFHEKLPPGFAINRPRSTFRRCRPSSSTRSEH